MFNDTGYLSNEGKKIIEGLLDSINDSLELSAKVRDELNIPYIKSVKLIKETNKND